MKSLRYLFGLAGGLAVGLALGALLGMPVPLPVDPLVSLVGNDYLFVVVFAAVAAVVTLAVVGLRAVSEVSQSAPPDPEEVTSGPRPGAEFDRYVDDGLTIRERLFGDDADEMRDRLRETAVKTTMRADDCDRETARRRVEAGEWTDDRAAASFLVSESPSLGLAGDVRAALRGESGFQRGARRTATAIAEKATEVRR
ncbi:MULTISPECIES: DUF7269 family protein [Halorussus]|uniref:DUF7269 family protein n=1 Tax=Halorussus TaxID=1070314 RepID=UPI00209C87D6|nr:hypothetical protein [Halorussus vallis]USZ77075.1 hypothetical protein NGM07_07045 [Halorussus vallis]